MSGFSRDPAGGTGQGLDAAGLDAFLAETQSGEPGGPTASMPGNQQPQVPTDGPQNPISQQPGQAGQPDGAAGEESAPRTYTEEEFQEHKANLQRDLSAQHREELSAREERIAQLDSYIRMAIAGRTAYQQAVENWVREHGGDERDLAVLDAALRDAEGNASRQAQTNTQALDRWVSQQTERHNAEVRRKSINPRTGQQLFDPNDPDIAGAFQAFLETGRSASRIGSLTGENPNTIVQRAHSSLLRLIDEKRDRALMGLNGQAPDQQAPEQPAANTPAGNRQIAATRGPQNTYDGGAASEMSEQQLDEMANEQYPGDREAQASFKSAYRRNQGMYRIR